eukprot:TRINITY_DN25171_c0_g2_i1.p1 TRINITY_DN25171_c0_g2~~TRINITY_DN25171_c0_g2_i1.p1  ORF type:complete len:425 (+),score=58.76 TRINITY_DN25171_c0_g2_i1:120-1277(+)
MLVIAATFSQHLQHRSFWFANFMQRSQKRIGLEANPACTKGSREAAEENATNGNYIGVDASARMQTLQRNFDAISIERGIDKFLAESFPTLEDENLAMSCARRMKDAISSRGLFVMVEAFPLSRLTCGDFIHVPEVVLNVRVNVDKLLEQLDDCKRRFPDQETLAAEPLSQKKYALRLLGQYLVNAGVAEHFTIKPRDKEPHVRLFVRLGTTELTASTYINYVVPSQRSCLLIEMGCECFQGAKLEFLVSKWARDRGISFENKGHLGPYAWSVLVLDFLKKHALEKVPANPSVWSLFRDFVKYYSSGSEGGAPLEETIANHGSPLIHDPFNASTNLGASMSSEGALRFFEELSRAQRLLDDPRSTLAQLLEHWTPASIAAEAIDC